MTRLAQRPLAKRAIQKVGIHHAHGCNVCGRRFSDTCQTPLGARTCLSCTHGHRISFEDQDRAPRACCELRSRLITDVDELSRYGLGGHTPWFRCAGPLGCSRTHPFDPTKEKATP